MMKSITPEQAERRDLHYVGTGLHQYHVTVWGDSAPKVQIGINANNQAQAEETALLWARTAWWKDNRKIGIELVEEVTTDVTRTAEFYAEVFNQFRRRIGAGVGCTREEALAAAKRAADEELTHTNPNWKWRKAKSTVFANPFKK